MLRKTLFGLLLLAPLGLYPLLRDDGAYRDNGVVPPPPLEIPKDKQQILAELAQKDPIEFLQRSYNRAEKEVHSYSCMFHKQEKVKGSLGNKEEIRCHFQAKPFSVFMHWKKGNPILGAVKSIFVKTDSPDLMTVWPTIGFPPKMQLKPDDPKALLTSRWPITEFGMHKGAFNSLKSIREAKAKAGDKATVKYEGLMNVKELGDRPCYKFVAYTPPDGDDVNELVMFIDRDTQLQIGSILLDSQKKLVAEYYFRDIELNPKFDDNQFAAR